MRSRLFTLHALRFTAFTRFTASLTLCLLPFTVLAAETAVEKRAALEKVTIHKESGPRHDRASKKTEETFLVEVVKDREGLKKGLSEREFMPEDHGMLFVIDSSQEHAFWMKGMRFPLDIIFLGENMHIIEILEDLQPCGNCPVYFPKGRPSYALEINAGLAKKLGLAIGDTLVIEK